MVRLHQNKYRMIFIKNTVNVVTNDHIRLRLYVIVGYIINGCNDMFKFV